MNNDTDIETIVGDEFENSEDSYVTGSEREVYQVQNIQLISVIRFIAPEINKKYVTIENKRRNIY